MFLRQSTSQVVRFGPMLDPGDGVTEETALTLAQADMRLSKDGGAFAQKNATGNATHDSDGWYSTTLNATDTDTVGELILNVHQPANTLPAWQRYWVIEEAIYDALFGAAATGFNSSGQVVVASTATGALVDESFSSDAYYAMRASQDSFGTPLNTGETTAEGLTTTIIDTGVSEVDDFWIGHRIEFMSGDMTGLVRTVTDWDNATNTFTVFPAMPVESKTAAEYSILPAAGSRDVQTILETAPTLSSGVLDVNVQAMDAGTITASAVATGAVDADALATDAVDKIRDGLLPTQNATFSNLEFLWVSSGDNVTPVTSASGTSVTRSIDGGSFAAGTGTLAEVGNGIYQYDASAADMNGGIITFRFVATGGTPAAPNDAFVTVVTGGGV